MEYERKLIVCRSIKLNNFFLKILKFKCGFGIVTVGKKWKIYLNNNKMLISDALFLVQVNLNYIKQDLGLSFGWFWNMNR